MNNLNLLNSFIRQTTNALRLMISCSINPANYGNNWELLNKTVCNGDKLFYTGYNKNSTVAQLLGNRSLPLPLPLKDLKLNMEPLQSLTTDGQR